MAVTQVVSSRAGHWRLRLADRRAAGRGERLVHRSRPGLAPALTAAAAAFALGLAAEWTGTRTGFPFGTYRYTGCSARTPGPCRGGPARLGRDGLPGYAVGATVARSRAGRIVTGAVALTAWDLFLDRR